MAIQPDLNALNQSIIRMFEASGSNPGNNRAARRKCDGPTLPNSVITELFKKIGPVLLSGVAQTEDMCALGIEEIAFYKKYNVEQVTVPKSLRSLVAQLEVQRTMFQIQKRNVQLLPTEIKLPAPLRISFPGSYVYEERYYKSICELSESSCGMLGRLGTLMEGAMFQCVECLDEAIVKEQEGPLRKQLEAFKESFVRYAYARFMKNQSLDVTSAGGLIPENADVANLIRQYPPEPILQGKQEFATLLGQRFDEFFSLFEYLASVRPLSLLPTKFLPYFCHSDPDKTRRFLAMHAQGLSAQPDFLKKFERLHLEEIYRTFSALCIAPEECVLFAIKVSKDTQILFRQMKSKTPLDKSLQSCFDQLSKTIPTSCTLPGTQNVLKDSATFFSQLVRKDQNFFLSYLLGKVWEVVEAIASLTLKDPYELWVSQVNVARLDFLLDYLKSCISSGKSGANIKKLADGIVSDLFRKGSQIRKNKSDELQKIIYKFLDQMRRLRSSVVEICEEICTLNGIDQYLKEKSDVTTALNYNLVLMNWLGTQVSSQKVLAPQMKEFESVQQTFAAEIDTFLRTNRLSVLQAENILQGLISLCTTSFFSQEHEILLGLKAYVQQWELLIQSPRGDTQIAVGKDQTLADMLHSLKKVPFEPPPKVDHVEKREDSAQPSPVAGGQSRAIELEEEPAAIQELTEQLAKIQIGSSTLPSITETEASVGEESIPKKPKKRKYQEQVEQPPVIERKPEEPPEDRIPLPLYWQQYRDSRKLVELAKRAGYKTDKSKGKGSHRIYVRDGVELPPIPYHSSQDLSPGVTRVLLGKILNFI